MSKNVRWGFTIFCTLVTVPVVLYMVHGGVEVEPDYSPAGFFMASVLALVLGACTFYIMSGATPEHFKAGFLVGAICAIVMETFAIAWIYGNFMRVPVFSFFVLFLSLMIEISEG